jgi:RNA polymerase II subunit A small phosphatase-like protein
MMSLYPGSFGNSGSRRWSAPPPDLTDVRLSSSFPPGPPGWQSFDRAASYRPPRNITGKKTLVLDLDETLIHSSAVPAPFGVDAFTISDPEFYVFKRPGLDSFLYRVSSSFDVFVFTYGTEEYARPLLDILCPWLPEDHRLYREACTTKSGVYKDLTLFNRPLRDIVLVDDSDSAAAANPKNTIQIPNWTGTSSDRALIDWLPPILEQCAQASDVRKVVKSVMNLSRVKCGKSIPINI